MLQHQLECSNWILRVYISMKSFLGLLVFSTTGTYFSKATNRHYVFSSTEGRSFLANRNWRKKGDVSSLAGTSVSYEIPVSLLHDECSRYPPPPLIILAPQPIFTKPIKYVSRELVHYFFILRPFLITLNLIIKHTIKYC